MRQEKPADAPPTAWLRRLTRRAPPPQADPLPIKIGLRTSISEFLLVARLRARNLLSRCGHAAVKSDAEKAAVMTRFAHILGVTCKNWFPEDSPTVRRHQPKL